MDDTYIHMAMARNLAEHGAWSINPEGFISASSSLLYTVLLAALFRIFGPASYMYAPLALNIVLACVILFYADRILSEAYRKPIVRFLVLVLVVAAVPLPAITFMSMEHVLHLLLSVLVVHFFARTILGGRRGDVLTFLFLLPFLCAVRYEGLFFLPPLLVILLARRRLRLAAAVLLVSVMPLVAFSAYSVSKGSFVLPNPIIIKGVIKAKEALVRELPAEVSKNSIGAEETAREEGFGPRQAGRLAVKLLWRFISKAWIFGILVLSSVFFWIGMRRERALLRPASIHYLVFVSVVATHVVLAGIGRQYRYEVYMMGMGFLLLGISFPRFGQLRELAMSSGARKILVLTGLLTIPLIMGLMSDYDYWKFGLRDYLVSTAIIMIFVSAYVIRNRSAGPLLRIHLALAAIMLVFLVPIVARGMTKQLQVPTAMRNIHEQQYQMGKFINKYYNGATVAVNDIGAVAYFGDATILDLWGLGDNEVLMARMRGEYDTDYIEDLLIRRGVSLVIVYDGWFKRFGGLPGMLRKAGMWEVKNNVVLGGNSVSFYALDDEALDRLRSSMRGYEPLLPGGVTVYY